jgi:hypothetical protein
MFNGLMDYALGYIVGYRGLWSVKDRVFHHKLIDHRYIMYSSDEDEIERFCRDHCDIFPISFVDCGDVADDEVRNQDGYICFSDIETLALLVLMVTGEKDG